MASLPEAIDGGWYRVNLVETVVEDGYLVVKLDVASLVVNRRHPGYWMAMLLLPFRFIREKVRRA